MTLPSRRRGAAAALPPARGACALGALAAAALLAACGETSGTAAIGGSCPSITRISVTLSMRSGGAGPAVAGLIGGAAVGALLGAMLGGVEWEPRVGVAIGIAIGLLTWIVLMALGARGVDAGARFRELWPKQTYETALETRAWLEQEWANRRERLAKRS